MKHFLLAMVAISAMLTIAIVSTLAAYTFNNMVEARRDLERKKQFEKMTASIEEAAQELTDKIPDFRLLNRNKEPSHAPVTPSNYRFVRGVGGR